MTSKVLIIGSYFWNINDHPGVFKLLNQIPKKTIIMTLHVGNLTQIIKNYCSKYDFQLEVYYQDYYEIYYNTNISIVNNDKTTLYYQDINVWQYLLLNSCTKSTIIYGLYNSFYNLNDFSIFIGLAEYFNIRTIKINVGDINLSIIKTLKKYVITFYNGTDIITGFYHDYDTMLENIQKCRSTADYFSQFNSEFILLDAFIFNKYAVSNEMLQDNHFKVYQEYYKHNSYTINPTEYYYWQIINAENNETIYNVLHLNGYLLAVLKFENNNLEFHLI